MKLLAKAMEKVPNGKFLIDGFPRNEDNVAGWDKDMQDKVSWTEGWFRICVVKFATNVGFCRLCLFGISSNINRSYT